MPGCFLGLGGNVGHVARTLVGSLAALTAEDGAIRVVRASSLYRTRPVGSAAGGEFLNAAAEVETEWSPLALLERMQQVESDFGRSRGTHGGPRPLDLDLLLYGDEIIEEPGLSVPHPALRHRRFVLDPLAEIAPGVVHPLRTATIAQLRQRMLIRPFRVEIASDDVERRDHLLAELRRRFPVVQFESGADEPSSGKSATSAVARLNPLDDDIAGWPSVNGGRLIVPDAKDGGLEFLTDVIAAATDEPVLVAGPLLPER